MPVISTATGEALSQNPELSLQLFLKDNWTILDPPATNIVFDTKYHNLSKRSAIFVRRRNTPLSYPIYGSARQTQDETFDIIIYAADDANYDRCWTIKERCKSLINGNPTFLIDRGIEWMWNASWTLLPISQNLAQVLGGAGDSSRTRLYVGRVTLSYDKVVTSSNPLSPVPPALKSQQLTRLEAGWTENPCKSVLDHLFTNWQASDPAKGATQASGSVQFHRNLANAAPLNRVIVRPSNETSVPETAGLPARDRTLQTLLVDVYSKGTLAYDKRWKCTEEIGRIIQSDVAGLWGKGIEEMYLSEFAINENEPDSNLARNMVSGNYDSWSTAKLTLAYTLEAA